MAQFRGSAAWTKVAPSSHEYPVHTHGQLIHAFVRRNPDIMNSMPEASPAQGTLKRLIEAEDEAREILKAAGQHAEEAVAQAREQAGKSVEADRREAAELLQSKLAEAGSKAAVELKQRLEQADAEAREFERRAAENSSQAVDMVVDWVTRGQ